MRNQIGGFGHDHSTDCWIEIILQRVRRDVLVLKEKFCRTQGTGFLENVWLGKDIRFNSQIKLKNHGASRATCFVNKVVARACMVNVESVSIAKCTTTL